MAAETEPVAAAATGGIAGEMEVEAYRRLFPLAFLERHLGESVRPDACRPAPPPPPSAPSPPRTAPRSSASAMLASIKLEVMFPPDDSPDEGSVAVEFRMPPICSSLVRPGRPAEAAPVISKALEDLLMSSGMLNLKELCLISGKASCLAYLDIYCLNADGSLFDAAWISAVAAFTHFMSICCLYGHDVLPMSHYMEIPLVSVGDDGRVFTVGGNEGKTKFELVNREKKKITLGDIPFSLTCALHKDSVLADPTSEEESIIETSVTVVVDSSDRLVSIQKLGGAVTSMATIKECISLAKERRRNLREILTVSVKAMEVDQTE